MSDYRFGTIRVVVLAEVEVPVRRGGYVIRWEAREFSFVHREASGWEWIPQEVARIIGAVLTVALKLAGKATLRVYVENLFPNDSDNYHQVSAAFIHATRKEIRVKDPWSDGVEMLIHDVETLREFFVTAAGYKWVDEAIRYVTSQTDRIATRSAAAEAEA